MKSGLYCIVGLTSLATLILIGACPLSLAAGSMANRAGCCVDHTGNVDCDPTEGCDISDLSALIDNLYISFSPLCCQTAANVDGSQDGNIDISDLSALIDYLYINFTPTAACPSEIAVGQIIFTEIMADPLGTDITGEWFELFNTSFTTSVDLKGCTVSDNGTDLFTINSSLVILPHHFVTLAKSSAPGFTPDYVYNGFNLSNAGDELILTFNSVVIDQVSYLSSGSGWPPVTQGASFNLKSNSMDAVLNDSGENWCLATEAYDGANLGNPGDWPSPLECQLLNSPAGQ
jgi:hypothetical protein